MAEVVFGMEVQFVFGWSDVTTPVALLHDMVFLARTIYSCWDVE